MPSLVLWLSLVGYEDELVLLKKMSIDELGGVTRAAFPHVGASSLYFHANKEQISDDGRLSKLANNSNIVVTYNADYTRYEVLSEKPRIFFYPSFLTDEECEAMKKIGKPFLDQAQVGDGSADGRLDRSTRSSEVHFLTHEQEDHWVPKNVKRKVHAATKLPYDYMESLQLQRYSAPRVSKADGEVITDFYIPHMDSLGGPDRRIATMIFYLDETEEGGETVFPLVHADHPGRPGFDTDPNEAMRAAQAAFDRVCANASDAPGAVRVPVRKGAAVLFYTLKPSMALDPLATHGSCPVKAGSKWISQQWVREAWQEPLYSHNLAGFWGLDVLTTTTKTGSSSDDSNGNKGKGAEQGREERGVVTTIEDTKPRPYYGAVFPMVVDAGTMAVSDPAHVIKLGDAVDACTSHPLLHRGKAPSVLSDVRHSHSFTLAVWVKQDGQTEDEPSEITLSTKTGKDCCEWRLLFENSEEGNGVMVAGPERGADMDEGIGLALDYGVWNQIVLRVDNRDALANDPAVVASTWKLTSTARQTSPFSGSREAPNTDFVQAEVAVGDVSWDDAALCVKKGRGVLFSDLFLFGKPLSQAHLSHLENTVVANKKIRDEANGVLELRG